MSDNQVLHTERAVNSPTVLQTERAVNSLTDEKALVFFSSKLKMVFSSINNLKQPTIST